MHLGFGLKNIQMELRLIILLRITYLEAELLLQHMS